MEKKNQKKRIISSSFSSSSSFRRNDTPGGVVTDTQFETRDAYLRDMMCRINNVMAKVTRY